MLGRMIEASGGAHILADRMIEIFGEQRAWLALSVASLLMGFPIFFGLGWLAARIDIKHLLTESRALPRSYFRGLNFLLAEQPDKAIEAFIEVVKVDPETVDLHFQDNGFDKDLFPAGV